MKISIKDAFIFDKGFEKASFSICDNTIVPFSDSQEYTVYDCDGLYLFPGFIDVHVHLREPGFSYKETIESGTEAAVKSGYTTVCSMPNLNPVPDSFESLKIQLDLIKEKAKCKVVPFGSITKSQKGDALSDFADMANYVAGFSDDGKGVQNPELMRQAMEEAARHSKIISAHCEENSLLNGGVIHDGEFSKKHGIPGICSESEYLPIKRDVELVKETGVSYHVCHISTKESVEIIRNAKREGVDITCETAPHYLIFDDSEIKDEGRFKMNPPIRSKEDKLALIEGISDGTIDMIATDHAPHSAEEKSKGLVGSMMGIVGLETAFPILYTELVKKGVITLDQLINLMSVNPKNRFFKGLNSCDFCLFDLNEKYKVNSSEFVSKGKSTPFEDFEVYGKCKLLICDGVVKYDKLTIK